MESTDLADFTKALKDIERRNGERLFYRLFPAADLELPGGKVNRRSMSTASALSAVIIWLLLLWVNRRIPEPSVG